MSNFVELASAAVLVLGSIGGGARWMWLQIRGRFEAIDIELEHCRTRERDDQERRGIQLSVIEILWQEVERVAPGSTVLRRAKKLLDDLKDKNKSADKGPRQP